MSRYNYKMTQQNNKEVTAFGRLLRFWRQKRKLSQLELAHLAATTPRHISFIETGRSRPGRALILRLARVMDLSVRDVNALIKAAGFVPEYAEYEFDDDHLQPYKAVVETMLKAHNPFPAVALDRVGNILMTNDAYMAFSPSDVATSPEAAVDQMFDPKGEMSQFIDNWEEIAWSWLDHQQAQLATLNNPRLEALAARAKAHFKGRQRPDNKATESAILMPRFRVGDQIISTFATMMRFENVTEVTLSEVRVELIFPADEMSRVFFENLYQNYKSLPC